MQDDITHIVCNMSFSVVYHFLIQKRKVVHRQLFFQRLAHHLESLSMKARHLWMRKYLQALYCHCQEKDIVYYVSTRNIHHFLKSLDTALTYSYVDDLCLDICYRHVCHLCGCRNNQEICLQPHH